jgi:hypothetical protein
VRGEQGVQLSVCVRVCRSGRCNTRDGNVGRRNCGSSSACRWLRHWRCQQRRKIVVVVVVWGGCVSDGTACVISSDS